jgi:hypothetical protein
VHGNDLKPLLEPISEYHRAGIRLFPGLLSRSLGKISLKVPVGDPERGTPGKPV